MEAEARLERLLGYLEQDCGNQNLAVDCAGAALAVGRAELAVKILQPFETDNRLDNAALNLAGLAAMRSGDQARAQRVFRGLLTATPADQALQFNLAWSLSLEGRHAEARDVLGDTTATTLPQAALLDLKIDHHLGELDAADAKLSDYLNRFPDYTPLHAAASMLAMDLERPDLARAYALKGGTDSDALATLGTLELGDSRLADAKVLFERALAQRSANPRANIGYGLVALAEGDSSAAVSYLDRGAEQFGNHLGSWIAAGWAHFLAGDAATARARFETAVALDATFGEAQGSLAAMDAFDGKFAEAQSRLNVAQRLDRQSFSAALTTAVLAAAEGNKDRARRVFEMALRQPVTYDGKSLADAVARLAN